MPEPSCTARKPVKFAVVLRGHLPNITICTTRNNYSCYTLKVPRRQPDPVRLFSHFSRNSAPGVCGRPQLKRRPGRSRRSGGPATGPPGRGTMGGISSPSGWTRRQPRAKRVPEKLRDYGAAGLDTGNCLQAGFRMPPAVDSGSRGEPIAAAGSDWIRASLSKRNG